MVSLFLKIQILIFVFTSPVYALECNQEFQFEYIEGGKQIKDQKFFCVLNEKKSFITNNCLKDCDLKKAQAQKISLPTGFGTPSHIECRKYGGLPMIVNLTGKATKIKTVLCKFSDGSMGTTDLLGTWK
jgi:hypothetical protein